MKRKPPLLGPDTVARKTQPPASFMLPAPRATNCPPMGLASPATASVAIAAPSQKKRPSGPLATAARKPTRPSFVTPSRRNCRNAPPLGETSPVRATIVSVAPSVAKSARTPLSSSAENAIRPPSPLTVTVAPKAANRPPPACREHVPERSPLDLKEDRRSADEGDAAAVVERRVREAREREAECRRSAGRDDGRRAPDARSRRRRDEGEQDHPQVHRAQE